MVRNDGIIPSEARLFRRIHKKDYWNLIRAASKVPPDYVPPKLFRPNVQGELSVDWDKFCTPEQTRSHTGQPEDFGVMQLITRDVRIIPLRVLWTPEPNNQAYSDIQGIPVKDGPEKVYIRGKLSDCATIIRPVPEL